LSLPQKICVVTSTRAEYGILKSVIKKINESTALSLQLLVTGTHMEEKFGHTISEIKQDGHIIDHSFSIDLSSDKNIDVTKAMGRAVIGFADAYESLRPDMVLVLGDRFEILAAAQSALTMGIPLGHISGGDVTEGAIDDAIRHSITKMAHYHFVTNTDAKKRVVKLGEDPNRVFLTGNPALDNIDKIEKLSKEELSKEIGFDLKDKNFLITFHPVTLEKGQAKNQIQEVLGALEEYQDVGLVFTMPNPDPENDIVRQSIEGFVKHHTNAIAHDSLGQFRYFNLMRHVDVVIGNSSSGLLEAPSFNLPCVNIGNRQSGRVQADLVFNADVEKNAIQHAIDAALKTGKKETVNPYGDGQSAEHIVDILEKCDWPINLFKKNRL